MSESQNRPDERRADDLVGDNMEVRISGGVNVNADRVDVAGDVVGRDKITQNIRQIVMSPWAWMGGVIILAATALLITGVIELPASLAFVPADEGESLIIVADFDDRSGGKYEGVDPAQYIFEQLVDQVEKDGLDVRVERLRQVTDDSTVRSTGEVYNATLVLWGWYDALTITPRMERIKTRSTYRSTEEGQHLSLADPTQVEFSIVTDLPSQATYLVLFALGLDKYLDEQLDDALAYVDGALGAIPANVESSTNPSEAHFLRGDILQGMSEYDRAIAEYDEALHLRPDDAKVHYNRGVAYHVNGEYDLAIADYDETIRLQQDFADAFNNRGNIYYVNGEYALAIADYEEVIRLRPDDAKAYNNLGNVYDHEGEYDLAIANYDEAIRLRPDYADAYYNRGIVYGNKGEYALAIADYNEVIRLRPDDAGAYYNRGIAYVLTGDPNSAVADLDRVIEMQADNAGAYFARGLAHDFRGDAEQAIADYRKVLELSDDSELRRTAEERLKDLEVK